MFLPPTQILTPTGYRPLKDLKERDMVYGVDLENKQIISTPIRSINRENYSTEDGDLLIRMPDMEVTPNQLIPVYFDEELIYVPAKNLLVNKDLKSYYLISNNFNFSPEDKLKWILLEFGSPEWYLTREEQKIIPYKYQVSLYDENLIIEFRKILEDLKIIYQEYPSTRHNGVKTIEGRGFRVAYQPQENALWELIKIKKINLLDLDSRMIRRDDIREVYSIKTDCPIHIYKMNSHSNPLFL